VDYGVPGGAATGWVGAHGGAGTSTLAAAVGGIDLGCGWPDPAQGAPHRILLVARPPAAGLGAASRRLDALRKGEAPAGLELLAVVLVADAPGRLPLKLARRIRVLRSAVRTQTFPWVPSWRLGEQPARPPRELSVLADLAGQPHRSARGMR
jgi:hypothetical protein